MDEGLLVWLVIFAIAIAQGIGQRKKKPGSAGSGRKAPEKGSRADSGSRSSGSGLGPRPSPMGSPERGRAAEAGEQQAAGSSSEGLVPADVWEEILGLARGEPPKEPEAPEEDPGILPGAEVEPAPDPVPTSSPEPVKGLAVRRRQDRAPQPALAGSSFPAVETEGQGPREKGKAAGDPWVGLFGDGSAEELRRAIVVREVLGPPVSLREE